MDQSQAEAEFLHLTDELGFAQRGLFQGITPVPDAIARHFPLLSRGQKVMLAFLLHVYDPNERRRLLPDYDWLAEVQALDRRNRSRLADWVEEPFFLRLD